jgi:hypothetical protein
MPDLGRRRFCRAMRGMALIILLGELINIPKRPGVPESADSEFVIIKGWVLSNRDLKGES